MNNLKLIVLSNFLEVGKKVNLELKRIRKENTGYIIPITESRFSNGEGKIRIDDTVRDKDIYIMSDVGNYGITYNMQGFDDCANLNDLICNHYFLLSMYWEL